MTTEISSDIWGRKILFETDGVNDTYSLESGYEVIVPAGTAESVVLLAFAKQGKGLKFQAALKEYVDLRYTLETKISLLMLYLMANTGGLLGSPSKPNRAAYIAQALTWGNSIATYAASFQASVQSQTSPSTIVAMTWDFTSIGADPAVTLAGAISINS